jgi:hypothetical protein
VDKCLDLVVLEESLFLVDACGRNKTKATMTLTVVRLILKLKNNVERNI